MHAPIRSLTLAVGVVLLLTLVHRDHAQIVQISTESSLIRVDVGLVHIPVTVTDARGTPIAGLRRKDFSVLEDGTDRPIQYFSSQESPVSLGIVFDASGSMQPHLKQAREAVARLLRGGVEGDEYFLIAFSDRPRVLVEPVTSADPVMRKLQRIPAGGWTALLDAAHLGLATVRRTGNSRKALILLSDGADNRSRYTETELRSRVRESDACVYAIGLAGDGQSDANLSLLRDLAEESGGRMVPVGSVADLPAAVEQISASIRNQYVLGYSPVTPYDGRYRKVTVKITGPASEGLHASWRTGYYSPQPAFR